MKSVTKVLFAVGASVSITAAIAGVAVGTTTPNDLSQTGWPRVLGSSANDSYTRTAVGPAGDVFVSGRTQGAIQDGASPLGGNDAFVARFDKYGKLLWVRQFGTDQSDLARGIVVVGSGVFVAGETNGALAPGSVADADGDMFLARYDFSGNLKWIRQVGTDSNDAVDALAGSGDSVYLAGGTNGSFIPRAGTDFDAVVIRYSTNGTQRWVRQFGSTDNKYDEVYSIAATGSEVYIVGSTNGAVVDSATSGATGDAFLARYDKSGNRKWIRQIDSSGGSETGEAVAVGGSRVYIAGQTDGVLGDGATADPNGDGYVIAFNKAGDRQWGQQVTSTGTSDGFYALAASSKGVVAAGSTNGDIGDQTNAGSYDVLAVRFSSKGVRVWARLLGTAGSDDVGALSLRSSNSYGGAVVVAGDTTGHVWGQTPQGNNDIFVAMLPF